MSGTLEDQVEITILAKALLQLVCTGIFVAVVLGGMLFVGKILSGDWN